MVGWLRRKRETIRDAATALSVLEWIPWKFLGSAATGIVALVGFERVPLWPHGLIALLSLLTVVWIVVGMVRLYDRFASKRRKEPSEPRENPSLESVRLLLLEAAEGIVAAQLKDPMSTSFGWYYDRILTFLESAFFEPRDRAMKDYVHARRVRLADGSYDQATAMAGFLRLLGKKITVDDLDPGFLLPLTFEQFEGHDGGWPKNVSPGV